MYKMNNFFNQRQPQSNNYFQSNQMRQPMYNQFNQFNQFNQNSNTSDSELKAVINTYWSLYNSEDTQCLFRLPVFNPSHANMPKIQFNRNQFNSQELEYLWMNAEQRLNPDPINLSTCLLIGLENIQKRVQIDKQNCEFIVKQLDDEISKKVQEIDHKLETVTNKKIKTIRDNNARILKRVILFEKKLFCIARKLKRADINLEFKMRVMNMLKELWKQMLLIDKNIDEIKLMIEGKEFTYRNKILVNYLMYTN